MIFLYEALELFNLMKKLQWESKTLSHDKLDSINGWIDPKVKSERTIEEVLAVSRRG